MEAQVDDRAHPAKRSTALRHVVEYEADSGGIEHLEDVSAVPAPIANLDGLGLALRDSGEEVRQSVRVRSPARGQLIEHRATALAEPAGTTPESVERLIGGAETSDVGQIPAGLDGEPKPGWHALTPPGERVGLRKAVEGRVQLDRIKPRRIELEP